MVQTRDRVHALLEAVVAVGRNLELEVVLHQIVEAAVPADDAGTLRARILAQAILDAARDFDAHVIVLGSRSRTGLPRVPFGSVATHLLHLATLPVLIVPMPWVQ